MKLKQSFSRQQLLVLIMLLSGIAFVAALSCVALTTQQEARNLSGAVVAADNASSAFYAAEDAEEMAELLGAELRGDTLTLLCDEKGMAASEGELQLTAQIETQEDAYRCSIKVVSSREILYELACTKARLEP